MDTLVKSREDLWGYLKRLRFVLALICEAFPRREAETLSVLDVGCGNGSQLALQLARDGFEVTGIDLDKRSIAQARLLAGNLGNVWFRCGRIEECEDLGVFDVVILSEVLEHTMDPAAVLAATVKHMADTGILIVTVPNGYGEFEIDSLVYRSLGLGRIARLLSRKRGEELAATDNQESGHVQFFTRRSLRRLFTQCGLRIFWQGTASFLAGPLVAHTLARSTRFIEWNARVTDRLPYAFASGWYFAMRRDGSNHGGGC